MSKGLHFPHPASTPPRKCIDVSPKQPLPPPARGLSCIDRKSGCRIHGTQMKMPPSMWGTYRYNFRCVPFVRPRENVCILYHPAAGTGSPPRMRGKPDGRIRRGRRRRIIPAHAGKAPEATRRVCGRRDHPRTRGESRITTTWRFLGLGSSPLSRGNI